MLSRLYDERVFTSSDDVVFGASSSRALLRKSHGSASSPVQHRPQRGVRGMRRDELVEEDEEESKSDDSESDDSESEPAEEEADDELDEEEEDEEEVRRTAGLKFPMQSPRHIAASKSYLHRQRRRKQALQGDEPTVSHRLTQAASVSLDNNHSQMIEVQSSQHIKAQYHDRPMELVYLPNGEIRPRDECPAGLRLPPPPATDVRRLLDVPPSPWMKARSTQVRNALGDSVASSIVHITRQEAEPRKHHSRNTESFRPSAIETQPKNQKHRSRTNAYAYTHAAKGTTDDEHPPKNTSGNGLISKPRSQYEPARKELVGLQQKDPVIASEKVKADPAESSSDEERDVMSAGKFTSDRQHRNNEIESNRYLEIQLQQEKRRVLEKMTLLLEEQGKTQALQHKVNGQEEKIAALQKELDEISHREASAVNRAEQTVKESNEKIEALSTKLQEKNDEIQRLSRQLDQATVRNQSRQSEPNQPKDDEKMTRLKQREASLAKQLEDLMNRVTDFHAHVERWKTNSREAINTCANASDVSDLMDRLWKDFPPFLGGKSQSQSRCSSDEESSTIAFLTKKLRQKEDELRVTHVKYVELKELCARQCIREADLQNFINEHRLRGNLIIRKNTQSEHGLGISSQDNDLTTENTNGVANGVRRRGRGDFALRPINSFDDDDSEGEEIVLRRPQVFIDVKRSSHSQQPETPVEHVRLEPSPASSQRHQNQRQGATTKYVQSGTIRQNKTAVNTSRSATVASAARTLGTTRLSQAPTVGRTPQAQKKSTTPAQSRATATSRIVQSRARTTAIAKRTPLSSRPWV